MCTEHQSFGLVRGNTCHGHKRFGTYLQSIFPRAINASVAEDGLIAYEDRSRCAAFTPSGGGVATQLTSPQLNSGAPPSRRVGGRGNSPHLTSTQLRCAAFTPSGGDRGVSSVIADNADYHTVFVGQVRSGQVSKVT